jgi:hypothetical protein
MFAFLLDVRPVFRSISARYWVRDGAIMRPKALVVRQATAFAGAIYLEGSSITVDRLDEFREDSNQGFADSALLGRHDIRIMQWAVAEEHR